MFTDNGIGMAIGVTWGVIGFLLVVIAGKLKNLKRLRMITYGVSLGGFLMAVSYIFDKDSILYVGTFMFLWGAIMILIDISGITK